MTKLIWKTCKMNIKPMKNEIDYQDTLSVIKSLMNAKPNTKEMDELEILTTLVEAYEEQHYQIDAPDPIEAIKFRMEQESLKQKDLIGSKLRVLEVLNRKKINDRYDKKFT